jgi:hypothetical protein
MPLVDGMPYNKWAAGIRPSDAEYQTRITGIRPSFTTVIYGTIALAKIKEWYDAGVILTSAFVGGSGYTDGTYTVPLVGGSGHGARVSVSVVGGAVQTPTYVSQGYGYVVGNNLTPSDIPGGAGAVITVATVSSGHPLTTPIPDVPPGAYFIVSDDASGMLSGGVSTIAPVNYIGRNAHTDYLKDPVTGVTVQAVTVPTSFRAPIKNEILNDVINGTLKKWFNNSPVGLLDTVSAGV